MVGGHGPGPLSDMKVAISKSLGNLKSGYLISADFRSSVHT
jgi:hypothetical protein